MNRLAKWDITSECNLNCKHCYNKGKYPDTVSKKVLKNEDIFVLLNNLKSLGFTRLHFLGGEPLLSPNLITALNYCDSQDIGTSITTNGLLLSPQMIDSLLYNNLHHIIISLEGINESDNDKIRGNGSFNRVINNIKNLVKIKEKTNSNLIIALAISLNKYNWLSANKMLDFSSWLGVDALLISCTEKHGAAFDNWDDISLGLKEYVEALENIASTKKNYPDISLEVDCKRNLFEYLQKRYGLIDTYTEIDRFYCNGGDDEFYIQADGVLFPCIKASTDLANAAIESGKYNHVHLPNIMKDSSQEIINSPYLKDFYNFSRDKTVYNHITTCKKCDYNDICRPCPLEYLNSSTIPQCEYAYKLKNDLDLKTLNSKLKVGNVRRNTLLCDGIEFSELISGNRIVVTDLAEKLWSEIYLSQEQPLSAIFQSVYESSYIASMDKKLFINNALDDIYTMLNHGLLICE